MSFYYWPMNVCWAARRAFSFELQARWFFLYDDYEGLD